MQTTKHNLIVILGPTAGGKTSLAAHLAHAMDGEIISADSRQVYRGMDLGTGKDLDDYIVDGRAVPYHLIDIVDAGYQYNVYEYHRDFTRVFADILGRKKRPILCGGTGLYLEAAICNYRLINVPINPELRDSLQEKSLEELESILATYKRLHNRTDTDTVKRAIRAIEIADYEAKHPPQENLSPPVKSILFGVKYDRDSRRTRITERLRQRLDNGMIEEAETLMNQGLTDEQLIYYGLEYKYLALYLTGKITREELFEKLNTAIHQFAKRQMTWFRGMERKGMSIHWLDGYMPMEEKLQRINEMMRNDR